MENDLPYTTPTLLIMTGLDPVIFYRAKKMAVSIPGSSPGTATMKIGRICV
jgi:hypothetical protein